jgi:threonine synthase
VSATTLVCLACGTSRDEGWTRPRCACGGLLEVRHAPPPATNDALRALFDARRADGGSGVWRFREMVLPSATHPVSHPEGNTPLLEREAVARFAGVPALVLKHEGHNPTGSFKDRGMTVGITHALRVGATAVACASTGNTSASMAAYAAQCGLPALVLVPAGQVAVGKLSQALAYGALTLAVRGDFDDALRLVEEASATLGVHLLNSINPFRVEGQKTIVLEMLQQLGWEPPDWIAVPAGNLGNTAAFGKAVREARAVGLIARIPRLLAVQAEGAAPFARGFRDGFRTRHKVKAETVATAIRIGDPASWDRAVAAIRETDGLVTAVSDAEILAAKQAIDAAGVGCEPASAASVAGVKKMVAAGMVAPDARVVAVLTGHVLKDPAILMSGPNQPVEIDADLRAVERALKARAAR